MEDVPPPKEAMTELPLESTISLLEQAKNGDSHALEQLVERSLPPLRRWARGRLPRWARNLGDTQDLVQDAVMRTLPRLQAFKAEHPGALQAFLRQAIANHIIDEIRKVKSRPTAGAPPEDVFDPAPSPLEQVIGRQGVERYEAALQKLKPSDRQAIIARIELQQSYEEVAIALHKPSANAARVAVTRALRRLLEAMAHTR
jgi:RNA polymerase sigma-70 factor (ECF subfamily)